MMVGQNSAEIGLYFFPLYSAPFLMIPICCAHCRVECVRPVSTVVQRPMRAPLVADMVILFPYRDTPIIAAIIMGGLVVSMSQNFYVGCVHMLVFVCNITHTHSTLLLMIQITR